MEIYLGAGAQADGNPAAVGARITVPTTSNMCGFDVALVQLDREIPGAKIAQPRFTPLATNETVLDRARDTQRLYGQLGKRGHQHSIEHAASPDGRRLPDVPRRCPRSDHRAWPRFDKPDRRQ